MKTAGRVALVALKGISRAVQVIFVALGGALGGAASGSVKSPTMGRDMNMYANMNLKKDEYRP